LAIHKRNISIGVIPSQLVDNNQYLSLSILSILSDQAICLNFFKKLIGLVKTHGVALAGGARQLGVSTSAISKIVKRASQ
jgi:hypothetical protein